VSDGAPEYNLVLPFVAVTSKGGPYDDHAYVAGYEMGLLDARLAEVRPTLLETTIHTANAEQADLIAMSHGYVCTVVQSEESPEWSFATFTPTPAEETGRG
jgi:hypothetical protein